MFFQKIYPFITITIKAFLIKHSKVVVWCCTSDFGKIWRFSFLILLGNLIWRRDSSKLNLALKIKNKTQPRDKFKVYFEVRLDF